MKKIILSLMAVMATMSINAQVVKVLETTDNGASWTKVKSYNITSAKKYKVVFEELITTSTAKAEIGGSEVDVTWVQLWEDGPKFAEYNVGATKASEQGSTDLSYAFTTPFVWGTNWRTPTKDEMAGLANTSNVTREFIMQDGVYGYKFTGVQEGYTSNSIFLPSTSSSTPEDAGGVYWTSTVHIASNVYTANFWYMNGEEGVDYADASDGGEFMLRPVLSE